MRIPPRRVVRTLVAPILFGALQGASVLATAAPSFTLSPLLRANGSSEPEIAIGADGTSAMVSLQWLFDPASFGTLLWTGVFGVPPGFQGIVDDTLQHPGKTVFGAGDADVDFGSTGRCTSRP